MLTAPRTALSLLRRRARREHGFTLVELLVAMLCGMVVLGALFAILEVGLHQSSRLSDTSESTAAGRITMTKIVDELHSACLSSKFAPVGIGSEGSKLILQNGYSETAELKPAVVRKDVIEYQPVAEERGVLRDYTYFATEGPNANGEYKYAATATPATGTIIGERVGAKKVGKESIPFFQYYEYNTTSAGGAAEQATSLKTTAMSYKAGEGLTKEQVAKTASVGVTFNMQGIHYTPSDKTSRPVDLNTQTTLAFSVPNAEATIKAGPCE